MSLSLPVMLIDCQFHCRKYAVKQGDNSKVMLAAAGPGGRRTEARMRKL